MHSLSLSIQTLYEKDLNIDLFNQELYHPNKYRLLWIKPRRVEESSAEMELNYLTSWHRHEDIENSTSELP